MCLLLHGTGASTHSWNKLVPMLAEQRRVIALDLPGHGRYRSSQQTDYSLPGMASSILRLIHQEQRLFDQEIIGIGHSAGAAILAQMSLQEPGTLSRLFSLNGAMVPLNGLARITFSPIARASANTRLLTGLFARRLQDPSVFERLLRQTGSTLDADSMHAYQRLCADPAHVKGALRMMAAWQLERLYPQLHRLTLPVHLMAAARDRMIAPREACRLHQAIAGSTLDILEGLGHLAHEESPTDVARFIKKYMPVADTATDHPIDDGEAHATAASA